MSYRVLIPTAGTGSRLNEMTKYINKSLISIANRPTISHIIEKFPLGVEFVVALGHKGHLVKEFLELAYPDKIFYFVEVFPYEGKGSGLGLSILSCKEYLQQPFVFISCDTLVKEKIPAPDHNWMGYAERRDIEQYRTLEIYNEKVKFICEKGIGSPDSHKPYIGLAGINDFKEFWKAMENDGSEAINRGEAHGLKNVISKGITANCFTWFDTGNPEALSLTRKMHKKKDDPSILEKANEAIWFVGNNVIKFSDDVNFIKNRVSRAAEINDFIPKLTGYGHNMYRYSKEEGQVLSKIVTLPVFDILLDYSKNFWLVQDLNDDEKKQFHNSCLKFYKEKTEERVKLFYKNFNRKDGKEKINGFEFPLLKDILDSLDWNWIAEGLPGRFHGDFHFENILYSSTSDKFTFLDWRQEFGGSLTTGDIYYDFAKLLHGLIICHELIAADQYWINWTDCEIVFDFNRKQILVECENYYYKWLDENGFDKKKVIILTALVFLNIAALHHHPYSLLLYSLGKKMLYESLRNLK